MQFSAPLTLSFLAVAPVATITSSKLNKVPVYLESGCTEIGKGYVTVKTKAGEEF